MIPGKTIKKYLIENGLRVEDLAKKIGISRQYLSIAMHQLKKVSPELAIKIEQATDGEIKKEWLVFPEAYKDEINEYLKEKIEVKL
ncbi:helix-turn-helix domain-containing protein [Persephonella sp.]